MSVPLLRHVPRQAQNCYTTPHRRNTTYMRLPETFLYGATIGAHQVEGGDFESDWWRWEQRPSRIRDGETSERGADHFTRYRADLQLARKLGHNAVCISLSWPRIHPASDTFDMKVLEHYSNVLQQAKECGMTPVCEENAGTDYALISFSWFSD